MTHDEVQAETEAIFSSLQALFDDEISLRKHGAPAMCRAMASMIGNLIYRECPTEERQVTLVRAITAVAMSGGSKLQSLTIDGVEYTNTNEPEQESKPQ
jgi:hypothetical protein